MNPANQRFRADRFPIPVHNRLQPGPDLPVHQCILQFIGDLPVPQHLFPHAFIVPRGDDVHLVLDGADGHMRPVVHNGDVNLPVGDPVNAQMDQEMVRRRPVVHQEIFQLGFHPLLVETACRQAHTEGVAAQPSAYASFRQVFLHPGSHPLQREIAERIAVDIVDHLEVADVRVHNQEFFIRITSQQFLRALIQIVPVVQSRQLVVPCVVQLPFHFPLFIRVIPHADVESVYPPAVVDQRPFGQLADMLPVLCFQDHLVAPGLLAGMPVSELSAQLVPGFFGFFLRQAQQFMSGTVHP